MAHFLLLSCLMVGALATMAPSGAEKAGITLNVTLTTSSMGESTGTAMMSMSPMKPCMTHEVTVGGSAGLMFSPSTINAAAGDMVNFSFMSVNHTVTQSTFALPCERIANGVDSGFMPNPNNTVSPAPTFMFQVMDTKPTWFYCRQKNHCGKGMVFSINPTADKSHAQFMAMAMAQNGSAASSASMNALGLSSSAPPATVNAIGLSSAAPLAANTTPPPPTTTAETAMIVASGAVESSSAAVQTGATIVSGTGTQQGDTCSCSCLCGVAAFPAGAGMGSFGGMSGSMPGSAMV